MTEAAYVTTLQSSETIPTMVEVSKRLRGKEREYMELAISRLVFITTNLERCEEEYITVNNGELGVMYSMLLKKIKHLTQTKEDNDTLRERIKSVELDQTLVVRYAFLIRQHRAIYSEKDREVRIGRDKLITEAKQTIGNELIKQIIESWE